MAGSERVVERSREFLTPQSVPVRRARHGFNHGEKSAQKMLPVAFPCWHSSHIFATFSRYMNVLPWILASVREASHGRLKEEKGSFVTDCLSISCQTGGPTSLESEGGLALRLRRAGGNAFELIASVTVAQFTFAYTALTLGGARYV